METTKLACQDVIDRIEELVPDIKGTISVEICIHIPTMADKSGSIPTYEIHTEVYPKMNTIEKIIDVFQKE